MVKTMEIKGTIKEIVRNKDKNQRPYLVLRLEDSDKPIFVFHSKFRDNKWDELKENENYTFSYEWGMNGNEYILTGIKQDEN